MVELSLSAELTALEKFFGQPLSKVDKRHITLARVLDHPDWLKFKVRRNELPRHAAHFDGRTANPSNLVPIAGMPLEAQAERIGWIVENLSDEWAWDTDKLWFANNTDVVHFRLRFALADELTT